LERAGQFPRRVQVGPNRVAWLASEIEEWIGSLERAELKGPLWRPIGQPHRRGRKAAANRAPAP
jgi:hypothetical protein